MTTIVKAAGAAEFLSLVPRMLGYTPSLSLVMIPFDGSRSLGAMRLDLPDAEAIDAFAATVIGMVCRLPDADAVAAIVYTDAFFDEGMPHSALLDAIALKADASGIRLTDMLCVAGDAWGSVFDKDLPPGGRPLTELGPVPPGLEDLAPVDGDQTSGAELPTVGLIETERVGRALIAFSRAVVLLCGDDHGHEEEESGADGDRVDPQALTAVCALDDLPALFEDALQWPVGDIAPFDAAALMWCLSRPSLRDVALVQWSGTFGDGDDAFDAQLRWEDGEEYPVHLAMRMWGEGERPDLDRLVRALALTRQVAALAPKASRPGALAMCAWLSWALGRSTHADAYARAACAIEPDHGLSEIVRSFVHAGHLPDWAFRRRVAEP